MKVVSVGPARARDFPAIVAIYNHYVAKSSATFEVRPVPVEERREWWKEHAGPGPYRIFVARGSDGRVLGWASTSPFRPRAGYVTTVESSVYLRPGFSGRRIGSRLYGSLFAAIAHEDVERIVAGVALPNPRSVALHRRFGFRRVGTFTRVGRKFGRFWDVTWFERPLRLPPRAGSGTQGSMRRKTPPALGVPHGTESERGRRNVHEGIRRRRRERRPYGGEDGA